MAIEWLKDVDAALAEAKRQGKPVLLDYTAAPM
jgi:thiol:disulfide interchange protein